MASEKNFENKIKDYLKKNNCWFIKYWGGAAFTKSGIPDILVCCKGRFMGIEVKGATGTPSDLQIYNLRQIDKAGGLAILIFPKDYQLLQQLIDNPDDIEVYSELKSRWKHFESIINEKQRKGE
ncbi:MAG: VRR-NUC domain-containing protein [Lachnospiraceae bacterium]